MLIDITLKITPEMLEGHESKAPVGHVGTHFDVMEQEFPLEYTERQGIVFDVRHVKDRDIDMADIDLDLVEAGMFVAFCSGMSGQEPYGTARYFKEHPTLSDALIEALAEKKISIIGIDFAGIKRGKEHIPKDRWCAERGVFVVENLVDLQALLPYRRFLAATYPMNYAGLTGLPCRVIAKV